VFDGDVVDAVVVTSPNGAARLKTDATHPRVTVIAVGEDDALDLPEAVRQLRARLGVKYLLCEGGPTLYGTLASADLIDEKFLTVAPVETGQIVPAGQRRLPNEEGISPLMRPTVFGGPGFTRETMTHWKWLSCRKSGDHQFHRFRRVRH
ncbi:MAG TPA: dihydrofolate reductase family protein, partial [Candidatus Angelobacter sp.]|nr:dihydrofolate reductase family protein [Candidatus Angelobacter sp.]